MLRHLPQYPLRPIALHGVAESTTHHDADTIMGKRIRSMQEFEKLRAKPRPFIEHSLKIHAMPKNVSMPSHGEGEQSDGATL